MNNQIVKQLSIFIVIFSISQSSLAMKGNSPGRPGHFLDQATATISTTWVLLSHLYSNVVNFLENSNPQYYGNQGGVVGTDPETGAPTLVWDDTADEPSRLELAISYLQASVRALIDSCFPVDSADRNLTQSKLANLPHENTSLEEVFASVCFTDVNISAKCDFTDFLMPNELNPEDVKIHLDKAKKRGLIVCTGTERSFFDLLLMDDDKCEGLVVRDINPRVKAYVDFNTLLLRISHNREEYFQFSSCIEHDVWKTELPKRVESILQRLKESTLPSSVTNFYLKHLDDFAQIYFNHNSWKHNPFYNGFRNCKYYLDDQQFARLQRIAKAGNIISTVGDMNDLQFLKDRSISVIDTSNICDYVTLDLCSNEKTPLVIWTSGQGSSGTSYYSTEIEVLTEEERKEFQTLLAALKLSPTGLRNALHDRCNLAPFYDRQTLEYLRKRFNNFCIDIPGLGVVDFGSWGGHFEDKLSSASSQQIEYLISLLSQDEVKHQYALRRLCEGWVLLDPKVYVSFSRLESWKDYFEELMTQPRQGLPGLIDKLKKANMFETFVANFGQERLKVLLEVLNNKRDS